MTAPLSRPLAWALAATLGATGWLALQGDDADDPVDAVTPLAPAAVRATRMDALPAAAPRADVAPTARDLAWPRPSPQALAAWSAPPPPPPPPRTAPVPPPVPAFPYRWIGRLDDGARTTVLLASAQRSVGVREGEVLDGRWRLDRLSAQGLDLTWLPTGQSLTVPAR